jgi:hypothetical protein
LFLLIFCRSDLERKGKIGEMSTVVGGSNYSSRIDDDNQVLSSSSGFASPDDTKNKQKSHAECAMQINSENKLPAWLSSCS